MFGTGGILGVRVLVFLTFRICRVLGLVGEFPWCFSFVRLV